MGLVPEIRELRREASEQLVERLAESNDPVLAYKARSLLRVFDQDAKTLHHTYRKWQGPHWTLVFLALIDYPPGDESLRPLVRRVFEWLVSKHFLEPPSTAVYAGQERRVRHCASQDGNALCVRSSSGSTTSARTRSSIV